MGGGAMATNLGVAVGYLSKGQTGGTALGGTADGSVAGVAAGWAALATNVGVSVGHSSTGTTYGIAIGYGAAGSGYGNVAIGASTTVAQAAKVPSNFTYTVELGAGTAVLPGGLNFRGYGLVNSNGVVIAPICTSNLTVLSGLTLTNGTLNISGANITGLNAGAISNGLLSSSVLPTNGLWNAQGMAVTNLTILGGSGGTQTLAQVLSAGNNGGGASISNVVIYGNGVGLTNVPGTAVVNLNANQLTSGMLSVERLPTNGLWNAQGLAVTNLTIQGVNLGTNYLPLAGGTVTNLTVTGQTLLQYVPAQGDLVMGSYTNTP